MIIFFFFDILMEIVKIQNYIEKIKEIQSNVLEFLEKNDDNDDDFQNLIKLLDEKKIRENRYDLKDLLYIISMISNNHCRTLKLFTKIERILLSFKDEIKQTFSNNEIYEIFKENKKLLLFLLKEKMINLDESIYSKLTSDKYKSFNFPQFFASEINQFIEGNKKKLTEESKELIPLNSSLHLSIKPNFHYQVKLSFQFMKQIHLLSRIKIQH